MCKTVELKNSKSLKYAGFEVIFWKESKHGLEHTEKTSECIISDYHWTAEKRNKVMRRGLNSRQYNGGMEILMIGLW